MQFLTVPGTNNLIVNISFIKINVTVRINLKKPNHNYPSHHNVSCDPHALYSLGGFHIDVMNPNFSPDSHCVGCYNRTNIFKILLIIR